MANVLFVCLHNAGRSQISEALLARAAGGRHKGRSAGTAPAERVHPEVVEAMRELGFDLADRKPRKLTRADAEWADVVVTMGCGDECPYIPGRRCLDWDLPDPRGQTVDAVRRTRDEIGRRVEALVAQLDAAAPCDLFAAALLDEPAQGPSPVPFCTFLIDFLLRCPPSFFINLIKKEWKEPR